MPARRLEQGVAHTEADLEQARRGAPEDRREVERGLSILDQITGAELFERAPLRLGHAAFAADEAADGTVGAVSGRFVGAAVFR